VVLLDLKKDRYLAIDADTAGALGEMVADWPDGARVRQPDSCGPHPGSPDEAIDAAERMVMDGLLNRASVSDSHTALRSVRSPTESLLAAPAHSPPRIRARHLIALAVAATLSAAELRFLPTHTVFRKFTDRQRALESARPADLGQLRELVQCFVLLRPYFYKSKDACLYDSLTLARYLFQFDIPCRWVIGVRDAPFCAHCWLMHGETLLNDTLEHVGEYTPIFEA
jgi:hypothetical protein